MAGDALHLNSQRLRVPGRVPERPARRGVWRMGAATFANVLEQVQPRETRDMDAMTIPLPVIPLQSMGPAAESCDGEVCAIPDHHTQAVINRKVDEDLI
jgi:hypothetical protein